MTSVPSSAFPVLVTGASGALGSRILSDLLARSDGGLVYAAGRRAPTVAPSAAARVRHLPCDLSEDGLAVPRDVRTIVHVAGEKRYPERMEEVNHRGTVRLLDAAARCDLRSFVHMSSVGVYGAPHNAGAVTEDFPQTPRNAYEASKARAERAVLRHFAGGRRRCVVLRPSNVLAVGELSAPPLLNFIGAVHAGRFVWPRSRGGMLNYVSAANVSAATLHALGVNGEDIGAYNINTPSPLQEIVAAVCDALGTAVPPLKVPDWIFEAVGRLGDLLHNLGLHALPLNSGRMRELRNNTLYVPDRFIQTFAFSYPAGILDEVRFMARLYLKAGLL